MRKPTEGRHFEQKEKIHTFGTKGPAKMELAARQVFLCLFPASRSAGSAKPAPVMRRHAGPVALM